MYKILILGLMAFSLSVYGQEQKKDVSSKAYVFNKKPIEKAEVNSTSDTKEESDSEEELQTHTEDEDVIEIDDEDADGEEDSNL